MNALLKAVTAWRSAPSIVPRVTKYARQAAVPAQAAIETTTPSFPSQQPGWNAVRAPGHHGGTVYPVPSTGATRYSNSDGNRIDDGRYTAFKADITSSSLIPSERVYTDPVKTFAYGTDASFYRLLPQMVVKIHNEDEVKRILPIAAKHATPVTFRAAGTSLSGQAVTDSILLKLSHTGKNFRKYEIKVRFFFFVDSDNSRVW